MDRQTGDNLARHWVPIDRLLSVIDEQEPITLRPRPRPVHPASDDECYRLNPPDECSSSIREAGLHSSFHRSHGSRA